jgi:hypothetical protein
MVWKGCLLSLSWCRKSPASHHIVIQESAYKGSNLLLKITMLLSVSKRLGISLEFLIFFLCVEESCAKWWSSQKAETTRWPWNSKLSRFFLDFVLEMMYWLLTLGEFQSFWDECSESFVGVLFLFASNCFIVLEFISIMSMYVISQFRDNDGEDERL